MNLFTKLGCYLIGWNPEILKECGEASHRTLKRYVSAIVILIIIWGSIGYCVADRYIGFSSLLPKLITSAVFILIVVCIERFIILKVGKLGSAGVFRMILAILMALLGSAIFDQIFFRQDIDVEMKAVRTEQILKETAHRLSFLDTDIKRTTYLIDSVGQANVVLYERIAKQPTIAATNVSRTSHEKGLDEKGKPIVEHTATFTTNQVANPLIAQTEANQHALNIYQKQLEKYQAQKLTVNDEVRKEFEKEKTGFLEELKALISILSKETVALFFYIFLFAFLTMIELLIVTSRNSKQQCDYDLIVEHQLSIKEETLKNARNKLLNKDL